MKRGRQNIYRYLWYLLLFAILPLSVRAGTRTEPADPSALSEAAELAPDGYYYDVEHVVLYLHTYGKLPDNYMTKSEARALGWTGGSAESVREGAAFGGDPFGNREGQLPQDNGLSYRECDIDTKGAERGPKRLVYSDADTYYYTKDHYGSFYEVTVEDDGTVRICEEAISE